MTRAEEPFKFRAAFIAPLNPFCYEYLSIIVLSNDLINLSLGWDQQNLKH